MWLPKLPENTGRIFPIVFVLACTAVPAFAQATRDTAAPTAAAPAPAATNAGTPSAAPAVQPAPGQAAAPAPAAAAPQPGPSAEPVSSPDDKPTPGTGSSLIPRDLSPLGMFMNADVIVKAVMIGLAFASLATWTILLVKAIELFAARRRASGALGALADAASLRDAATHFADSKAPVARLVKAALDEEERSYGLPCDGVKERAAALLARIETRAGRAMGRGTGLLATIGSTAPFVGLFGTVWGIMNSFIGISKTNTTNLAVVAPGIAEALLATACGLVAAIPAVVIYNMFARGITGYRSVLGDASAEILRLLSRDLDRAQAGTVRPRAAAE
jgi:biopolymer transport protein ExbB